MNTFLFFYNIFGDNVFLIYRFSKNFFDILIIVDLFILLYILLFNSYNDNTTFILLFHGSLPLVFILMSYIRINSFFSILFVFIIYSIIYKYLSKYNIFTTVIMIFNNTTMIFILLYNLLLKKYVLNINLIFLTIIIYLQTTIVLLYPYIGFKIHEVLVSLMLALYLLYTYNCIKL